MRNDTAAWHPAHGVPHVRRSLASGPEYPIVWLRQLLRRSHAGGDAWIDCLGGKGPLAYGGAHHVQGLEVGARRPELRRARRERRAARPAWRGQDASRHRPRRQGGRGGAFRPLPDPREPDGAGGPGPPRETGPTGPPRERPP